MDLQLYLRVMWRFRLLVGAGFLVAALLAFLSFARVGFDGTVTYRGKEKWESMATMLVTQPGFPWGKSSFTPETSPGRLSDYATVYAHLATSDKVRRRVLRLGPLTKDDVIWAKPVTATPTSDNPLPLIYLFVHSTTRYRAVQLAKRLSLAFREYIADEEIANEIPADRRVVVTEVKGPAFADALLLEGRSKTLPMVVFMTMMLGVVGLAFVMENLRPRVRPVTAEDAVGPAPAAARRTA